MKKTAVKWLVKKIQQANPTFKFDALIREAKAMEKEQIIRAHLMARCYDTPNSYNEAEQYYNETYDTYI